MKTITREENIALQNYLNTILSFPTSFSQQKSNMGEEGFCLWCEEWEVIEMVKYLINGKDMYYADPPPNRLRNSQGLWSKEAIEKKVIDTFDTMESVDQIIEWFKKARANFNASS